MASLSKKYITENNLKEINVCPNKSTLKTWILKTSITEIKKCIENSNKWKEVAGNIFISQKRPGWDKKSKKYFIAIINTYIDKDIISNLQVRSKQSVADNCRKQSSLSKHTYEEAKKIINYKNYDIVWTKDEFNKNYRNSKIKKHLSSKVLIPVTDQLCGHVCLPISLYQIGRTDDHGCYPLKDIEKISKQRAWMCKNKCRYKLNIYNRLLSFVNGLNVTIAPFENYFHMEGLHEREDEFENILKLPCGHNLSLNTRQINEVIKRVPKQIEDYKLNGKGDRTNFHQTDPLRQKEESLIHLCKCCASKDEQNKMCLRCWKIVKNEDIRYGHRVCKDCQAIKLEERKLNRTLEQFIHELVLAKYHDIRVKSGRLKCNITNEQIMQLWEKQKGICALSGEKMNWEKGSDKMLSIDRIDSINGNYVEGEIQLICYRVNMMKQQLSDEIFIEWSEKIALYRGSLELI